MASGNIYKSVVLKVAVRVGDGHPVRVEVLPPDTDLICPYTGGNFRHHHPCTEKPVVRFILGRHTRVACGGGGVPSWGGDTDVHSDLAKQEVVQAFWEEMLELHGHNPK